MKYFYILFYSLLFVCHSQCADADIKPIYKKNKNLEFPFGQFKLPDDVVDRLCSFLGRSERLILRLTGKMFENAITFTFSTFSSNPLDLTCNNNVYTNRRSQRVYNLLLSGKLHIESHIDLSEINIQGFTLFCGGIAHLTKLNLNENNIDSGYVKCLSNTLAKNSNLTTLDLGNNFICDEGIKHLADAVPNNTTLTKLCLEGNNIGYEGAKYLIDVLNQTSSCINIDLRGNFIGSNQIKSLSDAQRKGSKYTVNF